MLINRINKLYVVSNWLKKGCVSRVSVTVDRRQVTCAVIIQRSPIFSHPISSYISVSNCFQKTSISISNGDL